MGAGGYRYDSIFPRERFVQDALERHFAARGFLIDAAGTIDLKCSHPVTRERWQIEAKGATTQCGLDFRTGLGQLVQRMEDQDVIHAIAMPDLKQFRTQAATVAPWVVKALNMRWLLVSEDGAVREWQSDL